MTELETAWLAGLLEGEGSFTSANGTNGARVSIDMTDLDTLERAHKIMGGKLYGPRNRGNNKPIWQLVAQGDEAVAVMQSVLPYMSKRRTEKIKSLLVRAARRLTRSEISRMGLQSKMRNKRCKNTLSLGF